MEYYTLKTQQQHRASFESKMESSRVQDCVLLDAAAAAAATTNPHDHNGAAADQLRASFDARDLSSTPSFDIRDVVRASFQKERSLSSVDGRDSGLRESPRLLSGGGSRFKDPPRSSVDGGRGGVDYQTRSSMDSPRLSMRIKEAVRAAVEGRLDSVRSSFDSKESLRSATNSNRSREAPTPRSSNADSRLLVELRESPRLSRDAPRYSCDGRDVLRSTPTFETNINNSNYHHQPKNTISSRESLRAVAQKARDSPRLSVDGHGGCTPPVHLRPSVYERESPCLPHELLHISSTFHYHHQGSRSEIDGKDLQQLQQFSSGEPRRRVPSLVARLMGLEDLPDDVKHTPLLPLQQTATSVVPPETTAVAVPQQMMVLRKKPSKESKLLKGLLQYSPRTEEPRLGNDSRHGEAHQAQDQLKHMVGSRQQQQQAIYVTSAAQQHHQQSSMWNGNQEAALRQPSLSPKQLGLETMPSAFKQQEAREMSALRQKVVQAMPKHLTEAMLAVLKNADDNKRMPMSYVDMENRLRQLRLRSSLQEHKTLWQILEAMHSKGLLNGASRPEGGYMEQEAIHQEEVRHQEDSRYQNPPKQNMLPTPQEYSSDPFNASNVRNLQELKRMGSRLHVDFDSITENKVKSARPQAEGVASKLVRCPDEQQQSIVVMKPVNKPAKKTARGQNPALLIESMPNARSSRRGRETGRRTRPWGGPVNRPSRTQPGFGFGRESTGRFSSEEGAAFKLRRERILARAGSRDVQSEPSTPKSPKLIAIPQNTGKLRSSSACIETPENLRHIKVHSNAGNKVGESGRRAARSSSIKEETPKSAPRISSRLQSGRDLMGLKKSAAVNPEVEQHQQKEYKLRRSSSDGKNVALYERDGTSKSTGPAEVIVLRNKSSMGKRVTLPEPELRTFTTTSTPSKRVMASGGSKPGAGGKTKERISPGSTPTTPRSSGRDAAEHARKREEQGDGVLDHVRVTDGEALDQSNGRSPLVGLTNRLQSTEVGLGELEREGQGVRTPRAGIVVKKMFSNQEGNLVVETIDISSEEVQPSPLSFLDVASICELDVTPLALNKAVDGMQGPCDDDKRGNDAQIIQQADTALQEWRKQQIQFTEGRILMDQCSQQLLFLRESAKILPPQGEVKPLIIQSQAEKVYVRDVLVVSGATMGMKTINPAGGMIDTTVFDYLEEKQGATKYGLEQKAELDHVADKLEKERQVLDRRMLFDCMNDTLTTLLVPYVNPQPWMQGLHIPPLRRRPTGQVLVQQLWDELRLLLPGKPSEDICDSLYTLLQKDLVQPRTSWTEFTGEIEDVGLEIEKMIFKDLIEEVLFDLARISGR